VFRSSLCPVSFIPKTFKTARIYCCFVLQYIRLVTYHIRNNTNNLLCFNNYFIIIITVLTFVFIDVKPARNIVPAAEDVSLWQEYPPTLSLMCSARNREVVGTIFNVSSMTRPGRVPDTSSTDYGDAVTEPYP
jgi:hypothetical protein